MHLQDDPAAGPQILAGAGGESLLATTRRPGRHPGRRLESAEIVTVAGQSRVTETGPAKSRITGVFRLRRADLIRVDPVEDRVVHQLGVTRLQHDSGQE